MAYAIVGGRFVATLLTLLFLPALYVVWFRIKEPCKEPELRLGAGVPAAAKQHLMGSCCTRRGMASELR